VSWPIILVIIAATGVPCYFWGYRHGYKTATADTYGPGVLLDSVRSVAKDSPDVPVSKS